MTTGQRQRYHRHLWPAACAAQGWPVRDDRARRAVTRHATGSDSTAHLEQHQITALFTYLEHLAAPDDLDRAAAWETCRRDPVAYNQVRQGKWWEKKAYGTVGTTRAGSRSRLHRNRFHSHIPADPLSADVTSKEAADYLMTARARAQAKLKKEAAHDHRD